MKISRIFSPSGPDLEWSLFKVLSCYGAAIGAGVGGGVATVLYSLATVPLGLLVGAIAGWVVGVLLYSLISSV